MISLSTEQIDEGKIDKLIFPEDSEHNIQVLIRQKYLHESCKQPQFEIEILKRK